MTRRRENDEWTFPDRKRRWLKRHPTLTHLSHPFFTFIPLPRLTVVYPSWVNRNQVIMFHKYSSPKHVVAFFHFLKKVESPQWLQMTNLCLSQVFRLIFLVGDLNTLNSYARFYISSICMPCFLVLTFDSIWSSASFPNHKIQWSLVLASVYHPLLFPAYP